MKYLSTIILLSCILTASIFDVYTAHTAGRLVVENGDTIIVSSKHPLASLHKSYIHLVICDTQVCRNQYKTKMKHLYRTNGVRIEIIK